jgi:succinoglycan biosynthesis protein ExoM
MKITITIASIGRPTLTRTLTSLGEMVLPPDVAVDVVIADDSRHGAVRRLLEAGGPFPLAIRCITVGAGNVALARNACLDAASGDLIGFIDDDEWVAGDWLIRMLAAMQDFEADCVFGPVHPQYPPTTPDWIRSANPLYTEWGRRGTRVSVGRAGNTLVKRSTIERARLRFKHEFGQLGGEDTDFFDRLARCGARLVVTDDALVYEDAPPERLTISHFRHRALRKGQLYARFSASRPEAGPLSRAAFYAGATAKTAVGLTAAGLALPLDRAAALRMAMRGWMNLGKLRELVGLEPPHWT